MGLDVFLGLMVLIGAIRGWLRGFVIQAIQLVGLIGCVYEAGPVRDFAKPHLHGYLRGIKPELFDRLLWWAACVVCYVVTVGLATWLVRLYRRRPYGEPDLNHGDQGGGLVLGAAKAVLLVMLMVAGIERYALGHLKAVRWAENQVTTSRALVFSQKYQPAARIWSWPPVQKFVAYVQRHGLSGPTTESQAAPPVTTAANPTHPLSLLGPAAAQADNMRTGWKPAHPAPSILNPKPEAGPGGQTGHTSAIDALSEQIRAVERAN